MYLVQMASTEPYSFEATSMKMARTWEWWAEHSFQGWGGGEEPLIAWV